MPEVGLFPSILGKKFHPKKPYWGSSLSILLVASAENVGACPTVTHGWQLLVLIRGGSKSLVQPLMWNVSCSLFNECLQHQVFVQGHSTSKGVSQKLQGRRNMGFSLNFPTTCQLSKAQEMSSISYLFIEKSWELSESKTHRSQQEMKILSTLNKQGHSLIKRNCRDTAYFWQWKVLFLTDLFFACFMGSTSILTAFLTSTPWRQETQTCYCGDNHWLIYSTYLR